MTEKKACELFGVEYHEGQMGILPNGATVEISYFAVLFSDAKEITYRELVNIDGGELGYKPFFDKLKEDGLIS